MPRMCLNEKVVHTTSSTRNIRGRVAKSNERQLKLLKRTHKHSTHTNAAYLHESDEKSSKAEIKEVLDEPPRKIVLKPASFRYKCARVLQNSCTSLDLITELNKLSLEKTNLFACSKKHHKELTCTNTNAHGDNNINAAYIMKNGSDTYSFSPCSSKIVSKSTAKGQLLSNEGPSFSSIKGQCRASFAKPHHAKPKPRKCPSKRKEFSRWRKEDTGTTSMYETVHKKLHTNSLHQIPAQSCGYEAHVTEANISVNELAAYIENFFVLPKKMSEMAEMMYT